MFTVMAFQGVLLVVTIDQARRALAWSANSGGADESLFAWLEKHNDSKRVEAQRRWLDVTRGSLIGDYAALRLGTECTGGEGADPAADWRESVRSRQYVFHVLSRMISVSTLLAIVIELSWGLAGGGGIEALQAGLPQRLAFRNALTSLAFGFVTLGVCAWGGRVLRMRAARTGRVLRRIAKASGPGWSDWTAPEFG